ncbi:3-oxoacyl-[acyl-carrier-protein] synthase III C-terminal domain-containing protein, partial [Sphaerisporangium sp. NPDC049002]|uniref:3-oxoacyl-[acyl-carrier-protein] synthase III C-terminal domain-containing protein n=1 Tax=Sphaerisporangium sp. NPDC049002 TaxID=3155392 RepID=UPI0033D355EA
QLRHRAQARRPHPAQAGLGADRAVIAKDIVLAGNTSAASIPLALSRMIERGEVQSGDLALLLGFGAGLTYAGQVVEIP